MIDTTAMIAIDRLCGLDATGLVEVSIAGQRQRLHPAAARALVRLADDAAAAGFELAVASGWRSFDRQRAIWNDKLSGRRDVLDDTGAVVDLDALTPIERIHAVLRYSALPGASRHHWGSDVDVYDRRALAPGGRVQLTPAECVPDGVFGPFHGWLDEHLGSASGHGFFRPYAEDRGGIAPEPWHLSYAPFARECATALTPALLRPVLASRQLLLGDTVLAQLDELFARFVRV